MLFLTHFEIETMAVVGMEVIIFVGLLSGSIHKKVRQKSSFSLSDIYHII